MVVTRMIILVQIVLLTQKCYTGLKLTGFASQYASQNQPVANQINI